MFITKLIYKVVVIGNKAQFPSGAKNFDNYLQNQSQLLLNLLIKKMGFPCISAIVTYERDFTNIIKAFTITLNFFTEDQFKITFENNDKMSRAFIESMREANPNIPIIYNIPYKSESQSIESSATNSTEIKVMNTPVRTLHKKNYFGILEGSTFEFTSLSMQDTTAHTSTSTPLFPSNSPNSSSANKANNLKNSENDTKSNPDNLMNNQHFTSAVPALSSNVVPKQGLCSPPTQILQPFQVNSEQQKLLTSLKKFTENVNAIHIILLGKSREKKLTDIPGLIDAAKIYQKELEVSITSSVYADEFVKSNYQKFSDQLKKYEEGFRLRITVYQNLSNNEEKVFFLGNFDAQKHIVSFLTNKEKNIFARVCNNFRFFVNSHLVVSEALQALVKTNQLSFRSALILTKAGFDSFHNVTRNDIITHSLCVESLLMEHHIPSAFFTKIAYEPYGGVIGAFEHVENIKKLMKKYPYIVKLLSTLHPGGNQTIIRHADALLSGLNELNISIEDFLSNHLAKQAFNIAYSDSPTFSEDKWKEILSSSKQKALSI